MSQRITTNTGEKLSFFDLFRQKNYQIEIPIIQRDYAQGRISKEKLRDTFLDSLYGNLKNNKNIDLDFVYGSVSENNQGFSKFIPLDGQQRLTTLFLLHWYLSLKDGEQVRFKLHLLKDRKSRFTYETRISSREFCDALVLNDFDLANLLPEDVDRKNSLSKTIKNLPWYFLSWKNDPTINGALVMLDAIHNKFQHENGLFEKLTREIDPIVTFQFLNLRDLKLNDDLYIKMNARGKALTDFENFKAQFEKFLEKKHPKFQKDFSSNMDGNWCDLFWDYTEKQGNQKNITLDQAVLKYFEFITEMLFYKNQTDDTTHFDFSSFKIIEDVYDSEDSVSFLINSLNLLVQKGIKNYRESIQSLFENLFSEFYEENKVAFFDMNFNLLEKLIIRSYSFEHKDKLLLFAIINFHHFRKSEISNNNQDLKDYIRVCRNFIHRINQKGNSNSKDEFVSNLRNSDYKEVLETFENLLHKDNVYHILAKKDDSLLKFRKDNIFQEIFKAEIIQSNPNAKNLIHQLEDHSYLKGDLHNFELLLSNQDDIENLTKHFYEIWENVNDSLIIRSLLSIGDYSIWIGNCSFGGLYFFGKGTKWNRVLTDKDNTSKLKSILKTYFDSLKSLNNLPIAQKLEQLVANGLNNSSLAPWMTLFLKYPKITEAGRNIYSFAQENNQDLCIEILEGASLRSNHVNAFILAVLHSPALNSKVERRCWIQDTYISPIYLKSSIEMYPNENYWHIDAKSKDLTEFVEEFKLEKINDENKYKLYSTEESDFVEIAVNFINSYYK